MSESDKKLIEEIKKEYKDFQSLSPVEKGAYIGMYIKDKLNKIQTE